MYRDGMGSRTLDRFVDGRRFEIARGEGFVSLGEYTVSTHSV